MVTLSPTREASSVRAFMSRMSAPPANSWESLSWYACTCGQHWLHAPECSLL